MKEGSKQIGNAPRSIRVGNPRVCLRSRPRLPHTTETMDYKQAALGILRGKRQAEERRAIRTQAVGQLRRMAAAYATRHGRQPVDRARLRSVSNWRRLAGYMRRIARVQLRCDIWLREVKTEDMVMHLAREARARPVVRVSWGHKVSRDILAAREDQLFCMTQLRMRKRALSTHQCADSVDMMLLMWLEREPTETRHQELDAGCLQELLRRRMRLVLATLPVPSSGVDLETAKCCFRADSLEFNNGEHDKIHSTVERLVHEARVTATPCRYELAYDLFLYLLTQHDTMFASEVKEKQWRWLLDVYRQAAALVSGEPAPPAGRARASGRRGVLEGQFRAWTRQKYLE